MKTLCMALLCHTLLLPVYAASPGAKLVAEQDRERILMAAEAGLGSQPFSITFHRSPLSPGRSDEFFSMSDYYWRDPAKPDGKPYIMRDGQSNQENFNAHRKTLMAMRDATAALAAAFSLTQDERYAQKAVELLKVFFLDEKTRMHPSLDHAQAIVGKPTPDRGTGLIDTLHLIEVPLAVLALRDSNAMTAEIHDGLKQWFADYTKWFVESTKGKNEAKAKNNHAVAYWLQVAAFATFTQDEGLLTECRRQFKEVFVGVQLAPDGGFPLELGRTKPYAYSIFQLDNMAALCQLLSTPSDNLWTFTTPDGRCMARAVAYLYPYLADKSAWPLKPDIHAWEGWPVRQPALLFGGIAFHEDKYLQLWRTLKPDPQDFEIRRNNAITQPLLWTTLFDHSTARVIAKDRPNILFIMTDEHNARVMGAAGDKIVRTPNLDALAASGILFNTQYCSSPICMPSRHSLTTGKYVSGHKVWSNDGGVPEGAPTLPRVLSAAGYESFLVGSMHYKADETHGFNIINDRFGRLRPAVDAAPAAKAPKLRARPRLPAGVFPDQTGRLAKEFDRAGEADENPSPVDVPRRNNAIRFLRERPADSKPFFTVVSLIAPHYPFIAPEEYLGHYRGKVPFPVVPPGLVDKLPLNYKHMRNTRQFESVPPEIEKRALEAYYARVEWIDHQIGLILDALKSSPFADNTVVVYTTDHGENMGEHGMWMKCCVYDASSRVPLIMSWPGRWKGGQQRTGACGSVDLVQTIADIGGAKIPADWNGVSMLPWLDDANHAWRDLAVCEYYGLDIASGLVMIRQGDWKYVYHTRADGSHGPERELYNIARDPKEFHNLASDPTNDARMKAMHAALIKETGEDPEKTEARCRAGGTYAAPDGIKTP